MRALESGRATSYVASAKELLRRKASRPAMARRRPICDARGRHV